MNTRIIAQAAMHAAAVAGVLMVCAPAAINGAPQAPAGRQGSQNDPNQKEWIQLFNGRDLTGWTPKFAHHDLGENVNNTFRVEDGMLKVRYDKWPTFADQFGHLFYREPFSYYILAAEYRFVGEQVKTARTDLGWAIRNNGLMIHSPDPKTMLKDQDFPISIEVQLLGGAGDGKPRTTANLCTPGTNIVMDGKLRTAHCTNSKSKTYDGDQWVRVEVLAHGDELIRHMVEGETVLEYTEAADWRRLGVADRSGRESRWHAAHRRVHLASGRDRADRFSEGRAAEPGRLHRSQGIQLQDVLRES